MYIHFSGQQSRRALTRRAKMHTSKICIPIKYIPLKYAYLENMHSISGSSHGARFARRGCVGCARDGGREKIPSVRWFSTVYITIAVDSGIAGIFFCLYIYYMYCTYNEKAFAGIKAMPGIAGVLLF